MDQAISAAAPLAGLRRPTNPKTRIGRRTGLENCSVGMTEEAVMQQAVEVKKQKQMEKRRRKEEGCDVVVTEQAAGRP